MHKYADIPGWWFYSLLLLTVAVSVVLCTVLKDQVQLPVWGLFFACALAFIFTLPISIITATTNQVTIILHLFLFFSLLYLNRYCCCFGRMGKRLRASTSSPNT